MFVKIVEKQAPHLRRMAHQYISINWWYWRQFIILPFTELLVLARIASKFTLRGNRIFWIFFRVINLFLCGVDILT